MTAPLRIGLIGAGRIGSSHAEIIARRVPDARLVAVADPRPGVAAGAGRAAGRGGVRRPAGADRCRRRRRRRDHRVVDRALRADRGRGGRGQAGLLREADVDDARRRPTARSRPRRTPASSSRSASTAGSPPTSRAAHRLIADGGDRYAAADALADPRPGAGQPRRRTAVDGLHPDPDPRLRQPALAQPRRRSAVEVYATADALVAPDFKDAGLLDTAVVVITFDNGARAVAEASFSATYGYDVRGEVFGSGGMVTRSATRRPARWSCTTATGRSAPTVRGDVELFLDAYTGEFAEFVAAVREGRPPAVTGEDARRALADRPGVHRVGAGATHRWRSPRPTGELHPGRLRRDGLPRPAARRTRTPHPRRRVRRRDLGLDQARPGRAGRDRCALHVDDRLRLRRPDRPRRRRHPRWPPRASRSRPRAPSAGRPSTCTAPASTAAASR